MTLTRRLCCGDRLVEMCNLVVILSSRCFDWCQVSVISLSSRIDFHFSKHWWIYNWSNHYVANCLVLCHWLGTLKFIG